MSSEDKNETTRFMGEGVSFKAKLIGILEVSEARGDRMCQEALSDLKMAIRAAGEHKQRITINIAIDGLRLRDEKTGDSLYHHPVHKVSFIAQDMTDSRAFGYIFGSPDTGHRFFGIKTDKAASQVVIAMRDLFQVVYTLKKKEIEVAKQHLDKSRYSNSPLFSETSISTSAKSILQDSAKCLKSETKASSDSKTGGTAVADLVDLELELSSLQQGLNQMERITPSTDPFGSKDDPFGDSFTSYTVRPILPPPPSSGRDRSSRTIPDTSATNSSVFSPRATTSSVDADSASLLSAKDPRSAGSARKDFSFSSHDFSNSHDEPSSGDWFTPTGGNSIFEEGPLVPTEVSKDDKHEMAKQEIMSQFDVFTELDPLGTGRSKPYIDKKHFFQELKNPPKKVLKDLVTTGEVPSILPPPITVTQRDPFGEDPFVTEDPFAETDFSKQDPFETEYGTTDFRQGGKNNTNNVNGHRARSVFEKQLSMVTGTSPRNPRFHKQATFDVQFDSGTNNYSFNKHPIDQEVLSESECAPEPPPRPAASLAHHHHHYHQIKPPPLPPKKQANDLTVKPPPRPPHTEDSHYDYMDNYETAPSSLDPELNNNLNSRGETDKSPPLPVPARKSRFESDFAPERPRKHLSVVQSSEEDYLTPITKTGVAILPPPPHKTRRQPSPTTPTAKSNQSVEGLDITLSQLTLSGLNELATKLKIPPDQLSNMTLAQLTSYLSNFLKRSSASEVKSGGGPPVFKVDFDANFDSIPATDRFDRYAVFRELINEEIKQTKIDTEPEEFKEEICEPEKDTTTPPVVVEENDDDDDDDDSKGNPEQDQDLDPDKYAALRDISESEIKTSDDNKNEEEQESSSNKEDTVIEVMIKNNVEEETNFINLENKFDDSNLIEYHDAVSDGQIVVDNNSLGAVDLITSTSPKSPKSPVKSVLKSPVPMAITEIMQSSARLTSGSLSDVVSGSSPEVDNTGSTSEVVCVGKKDGDAAAESWAIFERGTKTATTTTTTASRSDSLRDPEKQAVQSEEGVSPWSSDSKEFGNGSPPEWPRRGGGGDSGSGGDRWHRRRARRDQEGWWDTSAEPETHYYPANRRSTDSYEEEYYECYDRPRRRKQVSYGSTGHGSQAGAGGHSSSSRDVSPWEEEPRRLRDHGGGGGRPGWARHARQHSFEKHRDRRHPADSWDEEEDYGYEDEHPSRFHRHPRDLERHGSGGSRDHEPPERDRWPDEDRRHRRRRVESERERDGRRCCPDWEQDKHPRHQKWAGPEPPPPASRRDRYYGRGESQESPWDEEDYSNGVEDPTPPYPTSSRSRAAANWKRPSSASEIDRKTGEIKSRHFGGGEGDRSSRYNRGRRSRSRDSQYSEPHRQHSKQGEMSRGRPTKYSKAHEGDLDTPKSEHGPVVGSNNNSGNNLSMSKKCATLASRSKKKESPVDSMTSTFPRSKPRFFYGSPVGLPGSDYFDSNDLETSEAESPTVTTKPLPLVKDKDVVLRPMHRPLRELRLSPNLQKPPPPQSLYEDSFSLGSPKVDIVHPPEDISIIAEEIDPDEEIDSFSATNFENDQKRQQKKNLRHRLKQAEGQIKKSESVNIFARESDPFDDDFFSGENQEEVAPPRVSDLKWTDDYGGFDRRRD